MKVSIIFDPLFCGEAEKAVWLLDTPANRNWFERQQGLEAGSALFSVQGYPSIDDAVAQTVWNAQEHHPAWRIIDVIGVDITSAIACQLEPDGIMTTTKTGFFIERS